MMPTSHSFEHCFQEHSSHVHVVLRTYVLCEAYIFTRASIAYTRMLPRSYTSRSRRTAATSTLRQFSQYAPSMNDCSKASAASRAPNPQCSATFQGLAKTVQRSACQAGCHMYCSNSISASASSATFSSQDNCFCNRESNCI
jgi:hypothetical protein